MKKKLVIAMVAVMTMSHPVLAADTVVSQNDMHFSQSAITIKIGDNLVMKNEDTVVHNIVVIDPDGDADDKGLQNPGQDITETFDKPGLYKIRCNIHPTMRLDVTVQ